MCPLRFILVFFSAILAGFLAWRSFRSSPELDFAISEDSTADKTTSSKDDKQERNLKMIIQDGFWVFVDMASGKYLWRNFKEMNTVEKVKSC
ncbi:hypothetical protein BVRB_3g056150 [Beta vulgaris subsp. vulgaris]|uniref:uncharacterized protein LOC104888707 n=1 Tax=Beta vulgaris subsp. vulgaris TaxID=3555 RepID=UPI00053F4918|nr:uncharacterized protein LOC104888707 [Beta vulgaris subsp. vulgaris]KMT15623.1 hypothetical protein BVRB_3g056150 [Beta vulgaris subsp. vulgaris]